MTRRQIRRWRVGLVGTLTLAGLGLLFAEATLLLGAVIPLSYVLYESLSGVPNELDLHVHRTLVPSGPTPGEEVDVTVTLTNDSDRVLPDVRFVDGVPDALRVLEGSPRTAVSLQPGEETTLSYTVLAKRGEYDFEDPVVRVRSLSAAEQLTTVVPAAGKTTLTGANAVRDPPLQDATLPRAGTLPTDSGGSGLEFYATRQYRVGDPMRRLNWHQYAKTGEFVTVEYREERAIRTVLVVDARPVGRVTPAPGYPTGTALCAYAGERIQDALDSAGVVTSVTAVGFDPGDIDGLVGPDGLPWIGGDTKQGPTVQPSLLFRAIQEHAEGDSRPVSTRPPAEWRTHSMGAANQRIVQDTQTVRPDGSGYKRTADDGYTNGELQKEILSNRDRGYIDHLLARLPPHTQVVICTPLLDNWPVSLAQELTSRGYPFLVVSPDVLQRESAGQRIAGIHRQLRIQTLERMGTTVSWHPEQPVDYALRLSLPHLLSRT